MTHNMNRTSRWGIVPLTFHIFIYQRGVGLPQWTCDTGCFLVTVQRICAYYAGWRNATTMNSAMDETWYGVSKWVSEWDLHAKAGSPFRAQASTNRVSVNGRRSGQVRPARQIGEPFSGAGAKGIYSTWYLVQNKIRLFYVQQNSLKDLQCWSQTSRFIAASIHRPKALVPAVGFKLRLPMKMWSTRPMSSSWVPPQNSSNPTFLRQGGDMLCQPPIAQTTNMRPCFDVGSIEKYVHSNIPLMKYFVPFQCPICARWKVEGRQLTCTTSGNESRDAPNVDST